MDPRGALTRTASVGRLNNRSRRSDSSFREGNSETNSISGAYNKLVIKGEKNEGTYLPTMSCIFVDVICDGLRPGAQPAEGVR